MTAWTEAELGIEAPYVKEKIDASILDATNFISTDNMLPNVGGITLSNYVPSTGKVTSYQINDILVSNIRPYFKKIWRARQCGGCSNDILVFRANPKKILSMFLYYQLSQNDFFDFMMAGANGVKMPRGNRNLIPKYKFLLPPLPIQQKIARILSAYDDLIENNLRRIKLLEEMAQITYEEWFVRMRFPRHETTPINPETNLPEGWRKKEIQDIGDVITGKTPSTTNSDFFGNDVPFIKTPDMADSPYVIRTEQFLSKFGADSQKKKYLPKNSLMVSCIGTVGVVGLVAIPSQTNQQINSIIFKNSIYTYFMYCLSRRLKPLLDGLGSNGATMTNVNKGKFEAIEFDCPNDELLEEFHSSVSLNFDAVLNLQYQNQYLRQARDILLPRLMTGKIDVESYDPVQLLKQEAVVA